MKIIAQLKLKIVGAQATPKPPISPILGQYKVNIKNFCNVYNNKTLHLKGILISTKILIFSDKTFKIILKGIPTVSLIKEFGINKTLTLTNLDKICNLKKNFLNTKNIIQQRKIILGTLKTLNFKIIND